MKKLLREVIPLTRENLEYYFLSQKKRNLSNRYINIEFDALRHWSKYTGEDFIFKELKEEPTIKATLSDNEVEAFLNLPPKEVIVIQGEKEMKKTWSKGYDTWTMFYTIMAFSGMRCGEVAQLTVDRVDFGRGVFVLEETKTHTPRMVPIAPNIRDKLETYIKNIPGPYLFPSKDNKKGPCVTNVDWHYNFHTRIKRLGIKRKHLTPYSLRHSFITRLLEEDIAFPKVMKIAGHKRAETTLRYTHLTTKDIIESIKKLPLIRRSTEPRYILQSFVDVIKGFNLAADPRFQYSIQETEESLTVEVRVKQC